ncbi:phage tail protein [Scandinavium sp.]|uniref:phage tail protein n=1 Tax=Scandinavium sp. TaxID=2830653 RepID=UPI0028A027FC|nr:phage tail protein [Scandinavium sp.]
MGLFSFLRGRKNTFTGTVQRTASVMTASANGNAFFGILLGEEWLRVYTNTLSLAEAVAFLQPGDVVSIEVQGSFKEDQRTWYRLVSVKAEQ